MLTASRVGLCRIATGLHTAAARGPDQYDEFLVLDVQAEFLNSNNAFIRDLKIRFLLLRFVCLFLPALLLFAAYEGVHFLDVFQLY